MGRKEDALASRAWRLLRLALMWARRGGAFKRGLLSGLKALRLHGSSSDKIHYGERQFSFHETPLFRLRFPCLNQTPAIDKDCGNAETSFLTWVDDDNTGDGVGGSGCGRAGEEGVVPEEDDEGVDARAEEFIARFHEQMKLQRQISLLRYNEMMHRSVF